MLHRFTPLDICSFILFLFYEDIQRGVSVENLCVSVESATNIAGALHLRRIYLDLLADTLNKKEFEKAVERL